MSAALAKIVERKLDKNGGKVYLFCFRNPDGTKGYFRHAGHYLGFTEQTIEERREDHIKGRNSGARLVYLAAKSGLIIHIARVWHNATEIDEMWLKMKGSQKRLCPCESCSGAKALNRGLLGKKRKLSNLAICEKWFDIKLSKKEAAEAKKLAREGKITIEENIDLCHLAF